MLYFGLQDFSVNNLNKPGSQDLRPPLLATLSGPLMNRDLGVFVVNFDLSEPSVSNVLNVSKHFA